MVLACNKPVERLSAKDRAQGKLSYQTHFETRGTQPKPVCAIRNLVVYQGHSCPALHRTVIAGSPNRGERGDLRGAKQCFRQGPKLACTSEQSGAECRCPFDEIFRSRSKRQEKGIRI